MKYRARNFYTETDNIRKYLDTMESLGEYKYRLTGDCLRRNRTPVDQHLCQRKNCYQKYTNK
jgi:hypothetical protein